MAANDERYVDYLDFTSSTWKRPKGPTRVWRVIDGRKDTANGDIPKFSIQEVPEELREDAVDFMVKYFVPEEPISIARGLGKDPQALREGRTMWRDILSHGVSVVALALNYRDPSNGKPIIAGINILGVVTAEDEADAEESTNPFQSSAMRTIMGVQHVLIQRAKVLERYGVDKYLGGYGLSVNSFFRGQGVGNELLRARDDIGSAYRIPVSETVFTATASQFLASRLGYEVLIEKKYVELQDEDGNTAFPGVTTEYMKVMGKRLY